MPTYTLTPSGDEAPNTANPVPATATHVNRIQTDNGDTGYLEFGLGEQEYFGFSWSTVPTDERIDSITLRVNCKDPDGAGDVLQLGVRISGTTYVIATQIYDFGGYAFTEVAMTTSPATSVAWTRTEGAAAAWLIEWTTVSGSEPRATYAELVIQTTMLASEPPTASGAGASLSPKSSGLDLVNLGVSVQSLSPKATAASLSPNAEAASMSPKGEEG